MARVIVFLTTETIQRDKLQSKTSPRSISMALDDNVHFNTSFPILFANRIYRIPLATFNVVESNSKYRCPLECY